MLSSSNHDLHLRLPPGHWQALQNHCAQTGESASAVIRKALGDFLDLEHHTIWQLSTSTAVVEGVFGEALKVSDLPEHGDFGIGTFEHLDGEGILLDGICWQARADGSLIQAPLDEGIPFWIASRFQSERHFALNDVQSLEQLGELLDPFRPSANLFVAIRITGRFDQVLVRSVSPVEEGATLLDAAKAQTTFRHHAIQGTLVGFWSPTHASSLNIPGYHLHFLSDDRRHGGHLLDLKADSLQVDFDFESNLRLALPETREFLMADLSGDPTSALEQAETKAGG
jgi:acetolactate decarboxylase